MPIDPSVIPWEPTRHSGLSLYWVYRNDTNGDAVVLIRMQPGTAYPRHRHLGEERVLVLQGGYRDEAGEYRAGRLLVNQAGSVHHPVALEADEPCILLATAHNGIKVLHT